MFGAGQRGPKRCTELGEVAAFVPDLVLAEDLRQETHTVQSFHGVLLFADVSGGRECREGRALTRGSGLSPWRSAAFGALLFRVGSERLPGPLSAAELFLHGEAALGRGLARGFTALTEKFSQSTSLGQGAEEVTQTLNHYMGDILEGDAVLVLWRVKQAQLGDTIRLVLQCSQRIQQQFGVRRTDVGLKLRLKIGISAGHMSFITVGDARERRFLIFGQAVGDVWQAQNAAGAGDVILSAHGWELCEQSKIRMRPLEGPAVKIDDGQPLECLSELRSVSCLFVKLHFAEDVTLEQLCKGIQDSSVIISAIMRPYKGEINKICMFDKGCTLLCVFGLPGAKVPCESAHALESALGISRACVSRSTRIEAVSVGVTTGTVFCGVVGHRVRHEYTVIGQKVNLAARLMDSYPGVVSCDTATSAASRLPRTCFKELPEVAMKGVVDPGTIYQYLGISKELMFGMELKKERPENCPLLGRDKEIALFKRYAQAYVAGKESHVLAFEGVKGCGKSHLLAEVANLGRAAGHRVVAVSLTELNLKEDYSVVKGMLAMAMGLQTCKSCSARQLILQEKLQGLMEESSYCLLNGPFQVEFPTSQKVSEMNGAQRALERELALKVVLQKTFEDHTIFVIDNAHHMDSSSWAVLSPVLRSIPSFVVMGFAPASVMEAPLVGPPRRSSARQDCRVCSVRADVDLQNTALPPSLKGLALTELDSMNFSERMVLKCAAIIGPTFSTELLSHILPSWTRTKISKILNVLVKSNILRWQDARTVAEDSSLSTRWSATSLEEENDDKWSLGEPDELQGAVLSFRAPLLREAAYELWPKAQRVSLHRQCAAFLEKRAHKCQGCGAGDFVPFHHLAVSSSGQEGESTGSDADQSCSASRTSKESKGEELPATTDAAGGLQEERGFWDESLRATQRFLAKTEETVPSRSTCTRGAARSCECKTIVDLVLVPLAQHHLALGNEARAVYYLLESAAAYLHVSNNYLAFTSLKRAEALLSSAALKGKGLSSFEEATLLSLKGEVCYNMGCLELAERSVRKALSLLKRTFPSTSAGVFFKSLLERSPHACPRKSGDCSSRPEAGRQRLPWLLRQSRCLALLRQIFSLQSTGSGQRLSRLAARMKLRADVESEHASHILQSYMEHAQHCQELGSRDEWLQCGRTAMRLSTDVEPLEGGVLNAAEFAQALSHIHLSLGNLPLSVSVGYRALSLSTELEKPELDWKVLTTLFTALLLQMR
ncbi:adenylate cyclase type 10-like [Eudromia elegans]